MLPDSSWSTLFSMYVPISIWSLRPVVPSSWMPAISAPKRTQRVHWMQRVMSVETSDPRFLSFTIALALGVARDAAAEAHREILELALAALVADRAVERMVDQQELHRRFLRRDRALADA